MPKIFRKNFHPSQFVFSWTVCFFILGTNAAAQWTDTNGPAGGIVPALAIHPNGDIFAGTKASGVLRSTSNGASWSFVLRGHDVEALAINQSGHIFAGIDGSGVYRSTDNGNSWNPVNNGFTATQVFALAINSSGHIFAGTSDGGIFRSVNNGSSWTPINTGLGTINIQALAINSSEVIFAGTYGKGVFRSLNNGDEWLATDLNDQIVSALAINAGDDIFAGTDITGVFRSMDGGNSWAAFNNNLSYRGVEALALANGFVWAGTRVGGVFRSSASEDNWIPLNNGLKTPDVFSLTINPAGHIFAGTFGGGIFQSTDNGLNWKRLQTGLTSTQVYALATNSQSQLFAGAPGSGVSRSLDNGGTWTLADSGLTNPFIYALATNANDHVFAGTQFGGVFRSKDHGKFWEPVNNGLAANIVRTLAIHQISGHIFAGGHDGNVYRSLNNGDNWALVANNLASGDIAALAINHLNGYVFAGTNSGGVFRSIDNGSNWTAVNNGLSDRDILALAVNSSGHVFAGTFGGGVFRSTDQGNSWAAVNNGLANLNIQALLMNAAGHLFAGTDRDAVFRSVDNGNTWSAYRIGLSNTNVLELAANCNGYIFAGTLGSGVFRRVETQIGSVPAAATNAATNISTTAATLNGIVRANCLEANVKFEYGTTPSYGNSMSATPSLATGASFAAASATITNLVPNTTYYFRLVGANSAGTTNASGLTFITTPPPKPALGNINPNNGSRLQTLDVVFTGNNFTSDDSLSVGVAILVNSINVANAQQLTANLMITATAATGQRNFAVVNRKGGGISNSLPFTVNNPRPILNGLNPARGNLGQTDEVIFTGENFISGVSVVSINNSNITINSQTVNSATNITANITITAATVIGDYNFIVTNNGPGGGISASQIFKVIPLQPTIQNINPTSGNRLQSLEIIFTGSNFSSDDSLSAGAGIIVNSISVPKATELRANILITAAAATGQYDFAVFNRHGGGVSNKLPFTVNNPAPVLTSIDPIRGKLGQPLEVVFIGNDFLPDATSIILGAGINTESINVINAKTLTAKLMINAAAIAGQRSFFVTNNSPGGGISEGRTFTIEEPTITLANIAPTAGTRLQNLTVTFTGANFNSEDSVNVGSGIVMNSINVASANELKVNLSITATAATGERSFAVVSKRGDRGSNGVSFTVNNPAPTLSRLNPAQGNIGETLNVTFTGANFFSDATSVNAGAGITIDSTRVHDLNNLTATLKILPAATLGQRNFTVSNFGPGGGASSPQTFTIQSPAVTLSNIAPTRGNRLDTVNVIFTGANFSSDLALELGTGIEVISQSFKGSTELTARLRISAAAATGLRNFYLGNSSPKTFTIENPAPILTAISPKSGRGGQTLEVVFAGDKFFIDTTAVNTGLGITVNSVRVNNLKSLTANLTITANAAAGSRSFFAQNSAPGGGTSAPQAFMIFPAYPATISANTTVPFPTLANAADYKATDYRLAGLPGASNLLAKAILTGTQNVDWQVYWDNSDPSSDPSKYQILFDGSNTFLFAVGRAFWIVNKGELRINQPSIASAPLNANDEIEIPLRPGYNLITNPFTASIAWSKIQTTNGTQQPLYAFNGSYSNPLNFEPYTGYYFVNRNPELSVLRIPYSLLFSIAPESDLARWRVYMSLSVGDFFEQISSFGVVPEARVGLDRFDTYKPRAFAKLPALSFHRPAWDEKYQSFASDMRPESEAVQSWDFEVRTPERHTTQLAFSGVAQIPVRFEVYLIDDSRVHTMNLREDSLYRFLPVTELAKFRVIVGQKEAVQEKLQTVVPPATFDLGANYPNPFLPAPLNVAMNARTNIPLAVPASSEIKLRLYNLLGRAVKTIFVGTLEAGRYTFHWDGRDDNGNPVTAGVYFYQLLASQNVALIKKMVLIR